MARPTSPAVLGFGQFFGRPDVRRSIAGFLLARTTAARSPGRVPVHTHANAHLVLVLDGVYLTGARRIDRGPRPVTLVYNPPRTTHRDRFAGAQGTFFSLSIPPDPLLAASASVALPSRPLALSAGAAVRAAERLALACERPRSGVDAEQQCLALLRLVAGGACEPEAVPPHWLRAARRMLDERFDEPLSVRRLAASVGVHPVHLIRSFRRIYGRTPREYLRERRLEVAASLLRRTDLAIAEVALRSGFADQAHLTHAFARALPLTPGAYRQRERRSRPG